MNQTWHELLFMHWRIPISVLRPLIPSRLEIDEFDGSAWIGVVPFRMSGVRPHGLPGMPWLSAFPELNVRTYVTAHDRPGVWFFSLDAGNSLAVQIARSWFSLPYFHSHMALTHQPGDSPDRTKIRYSATRTHAGASSAQFTATYFPTGIVSAATHASLEWFLTARYCLYTVRGAKLVRGEIDHAPWPLQPASCTVDVNTMCDGLDLPLIGDPHLLYSHRLDVTVWPLTNV